MKKRFRANEHTSIKAWIVYLSSLWIKADKSLKEHECHRFIFSKTELILADMLILIIAILYRLGVRNIETLIRRRLEENDQEECR